jgi:hypothetical protein
MKIERIHMRGFGRWVGKTFELPVGLSLWLGPNEAGKTTLVHGILAGLYGLAKRRTLLRDIQERYRPWKPEAPFGVDLEMKDAEGVHYRLERDFINEVSQAFRLEGNRFVPEKNPDELVARVIGLQGLALFKSTLLITQGEVATVQEGRPGEAIAAKVAAAEDETSTVTALRWIERELGALTREGRTEATYSSLQRARMQVDHWQTLAQQLDGTSDREEDLVREMARLDEELANGQRYLLKYEPLVQQFTEYQRAKAERDERRKHLEDALREFNAIEKNKSRYEETMAAWNQYEPKNELSPENRRRIEEIHREYEAKKKDLARLTRKKEQHDLDLATLNKQTESSMLPDDGPTRTEWIRHQSLAQQKEKTHMELERIMSTFGETSRNMGSRPGMVFGTFVAVLLISIGVISIPYSMLYGLLILAGVGLSLWCINAFMRFRRTADELTRIQAGLDQLRMDICRLEEEMAAILDGLTPEVYLLQVEELEEISRKTSENAGRIAALYEERHKVEIEVSEIKDQIEQLESVLGAYWSNVGVTGYEEYGNSCDRYERCAQEHNVARITMEQSLRGKTFDEWEKMIATLAADCRLLDMKVEEVRLEVDPLAVEHHKLRLVELEQDLVRLKQEREVLKERLNNLRSVYEENDRHRVAAELMRWEAQEKDVKLRADGLRLAKEILTQSANEVHSRLTPMLLQRTSSLFSRVTKGKYSKVRVIDAIDQRDEFRVEVAESSAPEGWISPDEMSSGTRDQLYISLRIALGEYLTSRNDFPLILDDPFVHFDPARLESAVSLLRELGKEHQILWFTKDQRLAQDFTDLCRKEISPI